MRRYRTATGRSPEPTWEGPPLSRPARSRRRLPVPPQPSSGTQPAPPCSSPSLQRVPGGGGGGSAVGESQPRSPTQTPPPAAQPPQGHPLPRESELWVPLTSAEQGGGQRRDAAAAGEPEGGAELPPAAARRAAGLGCAPPPPRRLSLHLQAARLRRGGRLRSSPRDCSHCGSALPSPPRGGSRAGGAGRATQRSATQRSRAQRSPVAASPAGERGEPYSGGARRPWAGGRERRTSGVPRTLLSPSADAEIAQLPCADARPSGCFPAAAG
ncbi:proline-rich protein HaeIII subfamily 1-like [Apus apus]|uniref:proline-rich protein HaeIII subfamily 1-like n=1 Tax=Apus apus TaxID=8895 RepID=UPI0021F8D750|nr:proline-rich protein HaeIII subfamily 1-like [Apus apus]